MTGLDGSVYNSVTTVTDRHSKDVEKKEAGLRALARVAVRHGLTGRELNGKEETFWKSERIENTQL